MDHEESKEPVEITTILMEVDGELIEFTGVLHELETIRGYTEYPTHYYGTERVPNNHGWVKIWLEVRTEEKRND